MNDPKPICLNTFGHAYATFHQAVTLIYQSNTFSDPHFAQQSRLCGGLTYSLSHYQGVYELNPLTSRDIILKILKKIRVPISGGVSQILKKLFPKVDRVENFKVEATKNIPGRILCPPLASVLFDSICVESHQTNASDTANLLQYFTRQCYIRAVYDFYLEDYQLFKMKAPSWAEEALLNTSRESCRGLTY